VSLLITDRDRQWIREWFEPYKYANINMIEKVFLKGKQYSYNIARKRLLEMIKEGYVRVDRDSVTNKNLYTLNEKDIKPPSEHKLVILNVLAEMKYMSFNIEHFEVEKHWIHDKGKMVYSDGFCIFTMDNRRYHYFIEVHRSNNINNLEKYDSLYDSGVVQEFYNKMNIPELKNYFPKRILLVSDREYSKPIELKHCQVIQIDSKLNNFYKVLI
jgi:hypothetical protein